MICDGLVDFFLDLLFPIDEPASCDRLEREARGVLTGEHEEQLLASYERILHRHGWFSGDELAAYTLLFVRYPTMRGRLTRTWEHAKYDLYLPRESAEKERAAHKINQNP